MWVYEGVAICRGAWRGSLEERIVLLVVEFEFRILFMMSSPSNHLDYILVLDNCLPQDWTVFTIWTTINGLHLKNADDGEELMMHFNTTEFPTVIRMQMTSAFRLAEVSCINYCCASVRCTRCFSRCGLPACHLVLFNIS